MTSNPTPASKGAYPEPALFMPHPNLADEINRQICQSEIEGGVFLHELPVGAALEVETKNRFYLLENRGSGRMLISGHPRHCPEPVLVHVHGSTWGKSMLKMHFIAGWGGFPLIGNREQIVEGFGKLSQIGLDGVVVSWPRYIDDLRWFQREIHPLLQQAGLR